MSISNINPNKDQPAAAPPSDIDLMSNTYTYVGLAVSLAKMQNCRVSTAMLYVSKVKKLGGYLSEIEPNKFKIINLKKIKETLRDETDQAMEM